MILFTHSTVCGHHANRVWNNRSGSENMWEVCLFSSQDNKILWLSNMANTLFEKFLRCAKASGLSFLDCAFWVLIGWAHKLWSHGVVTEIGSSNRYKENCAHNPCDHSLPAQPISIRKAQSRKKAHKPLHTSWISPKMCLPCLIIIPILLFWLKNKQTFHMFLLRDLYFM